ncbi:DUF1702 family protein [Rhizohabitans arisaemae]|uniref:DUF1702 family protein n=1 Tax=Rhizohabitans arisaemae TaxID=2720610 RepID=UPI0024B19D52|nr:DUF1702 family protein [Rhizohabitans arisaemae]
MLWQDLNQVDFGHRRFRLRTGPARDILETAGRHFLTGFNLVLTTPSHEISDRIDRLPEGLRGFAYEGAGMACTILDLLTLSGGRRVRTLLTATAVRHPHLVHVGMGWGYARMRARPTWGIRTVHPLLRWLAFDGFGFHQGFFHTDRTVGRQRAHTLMTPVQRTICDQGLGRMLWFHECADVESVALRIAEFAPRRRPDLWSGVGLAATYVGGATPGELLNLVDLARGGAAEGTGFQAHLAQGSAFAGAARVISGTIPEHTRNASLLLAGADVEEAARWTEDALIPLGENPHSGEHFQRWRAEIRRIWARKGENP